MTKHDDQRGLMAGHLADIAASQLNQYGYSTITKNIGATVLLAALKNGRPAGIVEIRYPDDEMSQVHMPSGWSFDFPEYDRAGFEQAVLCLCEILANVDAGQATRRTQRSPFGNIDVLDVHLNGGFSIAGRRSDISFSDLLAEIQR